jgi:hypothetical protein
VKDDLQEEVAQFVPEFGGIAPIDGRHDLVGFLNNVGPQRAVVLLSVPGAAAGPEEPVHDPDQPIEAVAAAG